jgi:hypothetical protein
MDGMPVDRGAMRIDQHDLADKPGAAQIANRTPRPGRDTVDRVSAASRGAFLTIAIA